MLSTVTKTKKLKTKAFKTDYHLMDQACNYTKDTLKLFCIACGLNPKSGARKVFIAKQLADHILDNIESLLSLLSVWDLELVRDLVHIGPGKGMAVYYESGCTVLFHTLLIDVIREPDHYRAWYVMADELREAIGSKAEEILADPTYRNRAEMLQFVQGMKTLYGIIPDKVVERELRRNYPETEENLKMINEMARCPENIINSIRYTETITFSLMTPTVLDAFNEPFDLEVIMEEDVLLKEFSKEEIINAGQQPYPFFHCEAAQRLKKYLCEEVELEPIHADSAMFSLWVNNQPMYDNFMRAVHLVNKQFTIQNQKDWDKMVALVNDFLDAAPCWALRGWSFEEQRKGKIEYAIEDGVGIEEDDDEYDDDDQNVVYTS